MELIEKVLEAIGYSVTWVAWNFGGKYIYRLIIRPLVVGGEAAVRESDRNDMFEGISSSIGITQMRELVATAIYNHVRVYGVAR